METETEDTKDVDAEDVSSEDSNVKDTDAKDADVENTDSEGADAEDTNSEDAGAADEEEPSGDEDTIKSETSDSATDASDSADGESVDGDSAGEESSDEDFAGEESSDEETADEEVTDKESADEESADEESQTSSEQGESADDASSEKDASQEENGGAADGGNVNAEDSNTGTEETEETESLPEEAEEVTSEETEEVQEEAAEEIVTEETEEVLAEELTVMTTAVMASSDEGSSGYILASKSDSDGKYYDAEGNALTETFAEVEVEEEGETHTKLIYINAEGVQVTQAINKGKWLSIKGEDGVTKYYWINGSGYIKRGEGDNPAIETDETEGKKVALGADGAMYENELVTVTVKNEDEGTITTTYYYAGTGGWLVTEVDAKIVADGQVYTVKSTEGDCEIYKPEAAKLITPYGGTDIYCVNTDGTLVISSNEEIEGKYYQFDENGVGTACKNQTLEIVVEAGVDGGPDKTKLIFINEDGKQDADKGWKKFTEDGTTKWCYVNDKGYLKCADEGEILIFPCDGDSETGTQKYSAVDDKGIMISPQIFTGIFVEEDDSGTETEIERTCYIDENGFIVTSATDYRIGDAYYDADENGSLTQKKGCWVDNGSKYVDVNGTLVVNQEKISIGDKYYTFDADGNGTLEVNTWVESGTRYVDADGITVTDEDAYCIEDVYYQFDANGTAAMLSEVWLGETGASQYIDADGHMLKSLASQEIDGLYYSFDESGSVSRILSAWIENDTKYVGADGQLVTGQTEQSIDGIYYDFAGDGTATKLTSSWIAGGTKHTDSTGALMTNLDEAQIDSSYYKIAEDGTVSQLKGCWVENGAKYVDAAGTLVVSKSQYEVGGLYYSFDGSGTKTAVTDAWLESDSTKYIGSDGALVKSAENQLIGEKFYNFAADGTAALITSATITLEDGSIYIVDETGTMKKDTVIQVETTDGEELQYIGADGKLATEAGFYESGDGTWYYVQDDGYLARGNENGPKIKTITEKDGNQAQFAFDENGCMLANEQGIFIRGYYYNIDADGYMTKIVSAWVNDDQYADAEGNLITNAEHELIDGKFYQFDENGIAELITDAFVTLEDGSTYVVDETGTMKKDTVIRVETSDGEELQYVGADGILVTTVGWKQSGDGSWYYVQGDGYLARGKENGVKLKTIANVMYAFDEEGRMLADQQIEVDGVTYEIDADGVVTVAEDTDNSDSTGDTDTNGDSGSTDNSGSTGGSSSSGSSSSGSSGGSGSSSSSSSSANTTGTASAAAQGQNQTYTSVVSAETVQADQSNAQAVADAAVNQAVTVQAGEVTISSTVAQTAAGSVNGNTITSPTEVTTVVTASGQLAEVATTAVGAGGAVRALLAAPELGASVVQTTVAAADGTVITQNAVVYADGTQIVQKSGADELAGFAASVIADEQAINSGAKSLVQTYNSRVDVDLNSYEQVGAAVTYSVTAADTSASYMQMEKTGFTVGQEIVALITDVNGNASTAKLTVGENGIVQYEVPGVNCIVRFLARKTA